MKLPSEPIIFNKAVSCICGPNDNTITPKDSSKLDYEVELGIVIGKRASYLKKEKAMSAVAGYFLSNDVSERVFQIERAGQWTKGKGCETFGPIGPWVATKDEIKDPQNLNIWLKVNGEFRQNGNTKTMVFGVAEIVWWCSQYFIMEPGDIIVTGTPSGVALGMKPPKFLQGRRRGRSSAATASARRSRRSSRRAPDRALLRAKKKPRACARGFRVFELWRGLPAREDRTGELVVQADADDVFLEADVVRRPAP